VPAGGKGIVSLLLLAAPARLSTGENGGVALLALARAGLRVVRLKGGDPLVFGRGGEEAIFLRRHGIEVRIVPGVTAALGCAAGLGVPLSHRGLARKIVILTGHACDGALDLDWSAAADPATTLAIYMGRPNAARISRRLIAAGLSPSTPAVAIENGTLPGERYWFAPLRALPRAIAKSASDSPLLVLIGPAVSLAETWPGSNASQADSAAA
jgi:siroheme synthase